MILDATTRSNPVYLNNNNTNAQLSGNSAELVSVRACRSRAQFTTASCERASSLLMSALRWNSWVSIKSVTRWSFSRPTLATSTLGNLSNQIPVAVGVLALFPLSCALVLLLFRYTGFDLVVASNIIDRLYNPRLFLRTIKDRIVVGGLLVIVDPYTWVEEHTPKGIAYMCADCVTIVCIHTCPSH